ncbi:MAG: hypothetical protein IT258_16420 [Saprospiraceae bacterium]|nr:hypothetical protein [Saprospiraceae bacterium]
MVRFIMMFSLMLATQSLSAKFVPGIIYTLGGDTLEGTIYINRKPCKLSYKTKYKLSFAVEFMDAKGVKYKYAPKDLKGFAILCKGEVAHRFVSIRLAESVSSSKLGYAGMFGGEDVVDVVFAEVMNGSGFVSQYQFTVYAVNFIGGKPSGNFYDIKLLKKPTDEYPIILESRTKNARAQLLTYLGDCPKVKAVLEVPDFNIKKGLMFLINDYNLWYDKNQSK